MGTWDGSTIRLYKNGVEIKSGATSMSSIAHTNSALIIGARADLAADYFEGLIDDVRIYNKALSAAEVLSAD